nr:DUF1045 domain-containing protein [Variovorax sp. dw_954]
MNERAHRTVTTAHRYAAYYAPAFGGPLSEAGSRWLGRSACDGRAVPQPVVEGVSPELLRQLTAGPRRYGWHATLKAPFALLPQLELSNLHGGIQAICAAWDAFELPALKVDLIDDFLALVPAQSSTAIHALAGACVTGLKSFARPLSSFELERRRAPGLTSREDALLCSWGYPFVLDCFRFHMSLTDSLRHTEPEIVRALAEGAQRHFDKVPAGRFDAISLFAEPSPGADFICLEQIRLGA